MSGFKLKQTKEELQALIDDISVQKEEFASLIEDARSSISALETLVSEQAETIADLTARIETLENTSLYILKS